MIFMQQPAPRRGRGFRAGVPAQGGSPSERTETAPSSRRRRDATKASKQMYKSYHASQRRDIAVGDALVLVRPAVGGGGKGEAHHCSRPGGGAHCCLPTGAAVLVASILRPPGSGDQHASTDGVVGSKRAGVGRPTFFMPAVALVCRRWCPRTRGTFSSDGAPRRPGAASGGGAHGGARCERGGVSACLGWVPASSVRGRAGLCMPCASWRAQALANVTAGFLAFC
jgi:hypothetical protein